MNKREQLINIALELFYKHGVHAVGINEILAKSSIAKKTLYNHFDSKDALIVACLEERDNRFMHWLTLQCQGVRSVKSFVEALFSGLDSWINNKVSALGVFNGCFFVNVSAEFSDETSPIYQQCLSHKRNVEQFLEQQLMTLDTENTIDVLTVKDHLLLLKEGSINCAFVMRDKKSAIKAKAIALNSIFLHNQ